MKIKVLCTKVKGKNGDFASYKAVASDGRKIDCRIVKEAREKLDKENNIPKFRNVLFELDDNMYNVSTKYEYPRIYISDYISAKDLGEEHENKPIKF